MIAVSNNGRPELSFLGRGLRVATIVVVHLSQINHAKMLSRSPSPTLPLISDRPAIFKLIVVECEHACLLFKESTFTFPPRLLDPSTHFPPNLLPERRGWSHNSIWRKEELQSNGVLRNLRRVQKKKGEY